MQPTFQIRKQNSDDKANFNFLPITLKTIVFKSVCLSKGNRKLHDIPRFKVLSHRERCVEWSENATSGKNRTLYVLMICLHCRFAAREATITAIIARIGNYTHTVLIVWKTRFYRMQCEQSIASIHRIKKNVHRCVITSRMCEWALRLSDISPLSHYASLFTNIKVLSHTERCVERRDNATNGKNRTLYVLMIFSHCRIATREATIAAIIARIGHVSNLTTHIQI